MVDILNVDTFIFYLEQFIYLFKIVNVDFGYLFPQSTS